MAITERDEIKCRTSLDMIEGSTLEPRTKADLKDSIEEAKANLNGRTLEERVQSMAQNQFDVTRMIASILIQSKELVDKFGVRDIERQRGWKDVISECRWAIVTLGGIIAISAIFSENIVELFKAVSSLFF